MGMAYLDAETFRDVVAATPLVSIDLLVEDEQGQYLLGQRNNRPAQGCWFVPGGRIQKNERLDAAFQRLTQGELGGRFSRDQARFLGVYEHLYDDSVFGPAPNTHYVVLSYHLTVKRDLLALPLEQHSRYRWWRAAELLASDEVHPHSQVYVQELRNRSL